MPEPSVISIDEAVDKLRTVMVADSDLYSFLAENGDIDSIFRAFPTIKVKFPIITIGVSQRNPADIPAWGIFRLRLRVNIYANDPNLCDRIADYMGQTWNIPGEDQTAISSDNWLITNLRQLQGSDGQKMRLTIDDTPIHHLPTQWSMRIVKQTT